MDLSWTDPLKNDGFPDVKTNYFSRVGVNRSASPRNFKNIHFVRETFDLVLDLARLFLHKICPIHPTLAIERLSLLN
jgi:hypothetical protein